MLLLIVKYLSFVLHFRVLPAQIIINMIRKKTDDYNRKRRRKIEIFPIITYIGALDSGSAVLSGGPRRSGKQTCSGETGVGVTARGG